MPCRRMHSAVSTISVFCCSVTCCAPGPPPGSSLVQLACAALNDGAAGLIPVPAMLIPPPPLGSGKSGTPCQRMQSAYPTNCGAWAAPALCERIEDPRAAIASAHVTAASAPIAAGVMVRARHMPCL